MHFMLRSEDDTAQKYHTMVMSLFRNRYKLRGKAVKGASRQYGRVKKIEDMDKMLSYTTKDENVIYKVNDRKWLEECIKNSYKKEEKNTMWKEFIGAMDEWVKVYYGSGDNYYIDRNDLVQQVIQEYMKIYDRPPPKSTIVKAVMRYDTYGIHWYMREMRVVTHPKDEFAKVTINMNFDLKK